MKKYTETLNVISKLTQDSDSFDEQRAREVLRHIHTLTTHLTTHRETQSAVNHPSHYRPDAYEAIDVIQSWGLNFALGNVVKYICRAGLKDPNKTIEDLEKALFYLKADIAEKTSQK